MNRRDILRAVALGGGIVAGELWIPGQRLISIPKRARELEILANPLLNPDNFNFVLQASVEGSPWVNVSGTNNLLDIAIHKTRFPGGIEIMNGQTLSYRWMMRQVVRPDSHHFVHTRG